MEATAEAVVDAVTGGGVAPLAAVAGVTGLWFLGAKLVRDQIATTGRTASPAAPPVSRRDRSKVTAHSAPAAPYTRWPLST